MTEGSTSGQSHLTAGEPGRFLQHAPTTHCEDRPNPAGRLSRAHLKNETLADFLALGRAPLS